MGEARSPTWTDWYSGVRFDLNGVCYDNSKFSVLGSGDALFSNCNRGMATAVNGWKSALTLPITEVMTGPYRMYPRINAW